MKKRGLWLVVLAVALMYTAWNQIAQYRLSTVAVSGQIVSVWESQGRHSSTLMYQVQFDYGVDTINADGYRHLKHREGDTFSASCQYVPVLGCAGHAYTGYVNTFAGRYGVWFMVLQILALFLGGYALYRAWTARPAP